MNQFNEALHLHNVRAKNNKINAQNNTNRILVIDLSAPTVKQTEIAPILLGAATGINAPFYWGSNALYVELNPGIAAHRAFETSVREALTVRLQH